MQRWNRQSLLKACEKLLKRPDCTLHLQPIIKEDKTTAFGQYSLMKLTGEISKIRLVVDPAKSSLVEGFLHEALHIVLREELGGKFNETLEEILVKALERELWIKMPKGAGERWRRLINEKLT